MIQHRLIHAIIAALFTTSLVASQGLQIASVYYDPIQAESGGEAIQLLNNGTDPIILGSTLLVTKQSAYPLPSITLLPGQGYLITDTGWSTLRDNSTWPLADLELPLSLANTDGFVELLQNETIDRLAWNSSAKAREGRVMTHSGEQDPFFYNSSSTLTTVEAIITVVDTPPQIESVTITDDSSAEGIQLLSYSRVITVTTKVKELNNQPLFVTVNFLDENYNASRENESFTALLPMRTLKPGSYTLKVIATDGVSSTEQDVAITVLASSSITVDGPLSFAGSPGDVVNGTFTVRNEGNLAKSMRIIFTAPEITCNTKQFVVEPEESKEVSCSATIPQQAPGIYKYEVRLIAS
jgi:hypothetical protein